MSQSILKMLSSIENYKINIYGVHFKYIRLFVFELQQIRKSFHEKSNEYQTSKLLKI